MSWFRLCFAVSLVAGCSSDDTCRISADCASGVCGPDGICALASADGGPGQDGGTDAMPVACVPNRDARIDRGEIQLLAGISGRFRTAEDTEIDTAGTPQGGQREWHLDQSLSGDQDIQLGFETVAGTWYEESFPDATYATRLSSQSNLLGVFQATDGALLLLGVVSPTDGITATELEYEPPVKILEFPIDSDSIWETNTTVTGWASGAFTTYFESYESAADGVGDLETPFGRFPVQRIRTDLTRNVGGFITTNRTYAFLSECFGTVATITSQDYETADEFTEASEVKRLAP